MRKRLTPITLTCPSCNTERTVLNRFVYRRETAAAHYCRSCTQIVSSRRRKTVSCHGMSRTKIYRVWSVMIDRCTNPNSAAYPAYGGRGINVDPAWRMFSGFYEWAKTSGYVEGLQLDRENNNLNYTPQNCRWVTQRVNLRKRSTTKLSETDAAAIKYLLSRHVKQQQIADWFGVRQGTIANIKSGANWKDVAPMGGAPFLSIG